MLRRFGFIAAIQAVILQPQLRAQVLDDIDHVHPAYTLSSMHPAAWHPQVAGMDFLPDGRMVLLEMQNPNENHSNIPTPDGILYLVENYDDPNPENIKYKVLIDKLGEPVGVNVVAGKIYVSEKNELNEYELDSAATKVTKVRTVAKIPHDASGDVNFQEYDFGSLYKDGYFYVVGGGAVKGGGKSFDSTMALLSESRVGAVLKIKESDGTIEMLNCGMRASNGIGWGPEGTIWVTDNQGSYRPGSQLTNIVTGANYGYPNKPSAFSSKPVTPPSLWLVHGEIARSPTYPHLMSQGPYAGQFLVGDLSQGGIKRAFVENVNGAWQGCAFSFTGGLEVGIEIIKEGKDGTLYIGGLGRGDAANWGWAGRLSGLQKLTPKAGVSVFEMLAIRSRKAGMEIEFTKPVGASGESAASYQVSEGTMAPESGYGLGSMTNRHNLTIKSVQVSADRMKVHLEITALTAGRVLQIKAVGVKSQSGDSLRCPSGWYTLNSISPTDPFTITSKIDGRPPLANSISADRISISAGRGEVRIALPFEGPHRLALKTLQGRILAEREGQGAAEYGFARAGLRSGLYLLEVRVGGRILRKTFIQ